MKDIILPDWLAPLRDTGHLAQFAAGTVIFPQGDTLTEVGFVLKGKAKATAFSSHGDETWLCEFEPGALGLPDLTGPTVMLGSTVGL